MRYFNYLRLPVASTSYVIVFILLILVFALFLFTVAVVKKFFEKRRYRASFFKEAMDKGLSEKEAEILWEYSVKEGRDPFLTLEFKVAFEKVVDFYLHTAPDADEEIVRSMREKLGFDAVPFFVPLVSTKDIELFQPARVELADGYSADVALFDKDERYMYWAFTDPFPMNRIKTGDEVTFVFIRKADAIYKLLFPIYKKLLFQRDQETYIVASAFVIKTKVTSSPVFILFIGKGSVKCPIHIPLVFIKKCHIRRINIRKFTSRRAIEKKHVYTFLAFKDQSLEIKKEEEAIKTRGLFLHRSFNFFYPHQDAV
ncbi:hypothetical protein [Desulfurobacterium sp. TC5-1]|uniref:hypothetical protein n=1 Tax=Desulfurobacterium sp. TC5-1 TaxID=1158318 RepID=UPI0003B64064|nr:hypothetical protein [Desulfurobacterium sp. TC5-1]